MAAKPVDPISEETPRQRTCGTMPVHERLLRTNPDYARARNASENGHFDYLQRGPSGARAGVTVIPTVVHVVHHTNAQNISDAQVKSQLEVLNRDFRMLNADTSTVPQAFKPLIADSRVEFELATTDPNGAATSGITRTQTNSTGFSDDDRVKSAATGGANAWPADRYLNLWVCPLSGGLLGYAQFPGGPAATDGVVILHSAFGTSGTAAAPFNLGRTATHEIGHWLNLRHIWGDDGTGCSGSDYVADTPNQGGPNYGTPAFPHVSCNNGPNGDLFMDYMDYVDDAAMTMFTAGQVNRMQACLDADRSSIGHQKPGPTLKFRDDPIATLRFSDEPLPSFKFRDDPLPTLKFRDDFPGTFKQIEDVKLPVFDKPPQSDFPAFPGFGPQGGFRAAPFVLSTPHHSMAWKQSFPQEARAAMETYLQQIVRYEQLLQGYAAAESAGTLSPGERGQADAMYQEYTALIQEYQQLVGG
jgi:hypothetical protein